MERDDLVPFPLPFGGAPFPYARPGRRGAVSFQVEQVILGRKRQAGDRPGRDRLDDLPHRCGQDSVERKKFRLLQDGDKISVDGDRWRSTYRFQRQAIVGHPLAGVDKLPALRNERIAPGGFGGTEAGGIGVPQH